jgi:hypothetical protein
MILIPLENAAAAAADSMNTNNASSLTTSQVEHMLQNAEGCLIGGLLAAVYACSSFLQYQSPSH